VHTLPGRVIREERLRLVCRDYLAAPAVHGASR